MILLSQLNAVQALEEKNAISSPTGLIEVLQSNGVETKGLVLIEDHDNEDEAGVSEKFSGICCKRFVPRVGYVVNCVPYRGNELNNAFRDSCYKWGGDAYQYVNTNEEEMKARYGLEINFDNN